MGTCDVTTSCPLLSPAAGPHHLPDPRPPPHITAGDAGRRAGGLGEMDPPAPRGLSPVAELLGLVAMGQGQGVGASMGQGTEET